MLSFNNCFLLWNFSSAQLLGKIEHLQKSAWGILSNDYGNIYEDLLEKSGCPNKNFRRQRTVYIEIYKTLNKLNPGYMDDIFEFRNTNSLTREIYKLNLETPKHSQVTFGSWFHRAMVQKYEMDYPTIQKLQ